MNKDPHSDPTHTKVMRARAAAEMGKRFRRLKGVINTSIITNDCFGLRPVSNVAPTALPPRVLADRPDASKLEGFMDWLKAQEEKDILEIIPTPTGPETWQSQYIRPAYTKGYATADAQLVQIGALETRLTTDQVIRAMTLPINVNRLQLAYSQSFEALKGITAQMDAQISTILAEGLAAGASPVQIAGAINNRVDNIGMVRAKMIARTEVVTAHNMGALSEFEQASGIIGETIFSQWQATLDGNARPNHLARHGKIFKRKDAVLLLNEPNCRCALLPYVESIEGDVERFSKASEFRDPKTGKAIKKAEPKPKTTKPVTRTDLNRKIESDEAYNTALSNLSKASSENERVVREAKEVRKTPFKERTDKQKAVISSQMEVGDQLRSAQAAITRSRNNARNKALSAAPTYKSKGYGLPVFDDSAGMPIPRLVDRNLYIEQNPLWGKFENKLPKGWSVDGVKGSYSTTSNYGVVIDPSGKKHTVRIADHPGKSDLPGNAIKRLVAEHEEAA